MKKITFSKKDVADIIKLYTVDNISVREIGKRFSLSYTPILRILKENGISIINKTQFKAKYTLIDDFFEKIDSEEKAYFLGLLYADGYVSKKENVCSISLQEEDVDILQKMNKSIGSNRPISITPPPKKFPHRKILRGLSIVNNNFTRHLINKGCINKKSFVIVFPNFLEKNLINHFIRGYFDGDGCVYKKRESVAFELVGTEMFNSEVQNIFIDQCGVSKTKLAIRYVDKNTNTRTLRYSGKNALKIRDFLYKDATVYLQRKYDKFYN